MHAKWHISNGSAELSPAGIFANSNYLDINLLAIYKNSNYFHCRKLTAKNMCTAFISDRFLQARQNTPERYYIKNIALFYTLSVVLKHFLLYLHP